MSSLVLIRWCVLMHPRACGCLCGYVHVAVCGRMIISDCFFSPGALIRQPSHVYPPASRRHWLSSPLPSLHIYGCFCWCWKKKKEVSSESPQNECYYSFILLPLCFNTTIRFFCTVRNNHPFGRHFPFILCWVFFCTGVVTSNLIFFCFKLKISFCYTWHWKSVCEIQGCPMACIHDIL